jgi:hypothetical protein
MLPHGRFEMSLSQLILSSDGLGELRATDLRVEMISDMLFPKQKQIRNKEMAVTGTRLAANIEHY